MDSGETQRRLTGVSALINLFRESLLALIPVLEKANLKWEQLQEIDLFDNITETLFQLIVLPKIENYMTKKHNFLPPMPKYGFFYKDYSKTSFIEVLPNNVEHTSGTYVFVMFNSVQEPFDTVVCNVIDEKGNVMKRNIEIPYADVLFRYQYKGPEGNVVLS
ncbi:hypothetical protein D9V84_10925 [Bacteroidetes/Chlorobi group bacterium Naka2016]|jgi:hypothetical protein|nr:MAG: hypothetical protein D9V84_10925 [Bacteroidetes/Chlorobi group bacterium Naka2016]